MHHAKHSVLPLPVRLLCGALTWLLALGAVPTVAFAAPAKPAAAPATPATAGRTVALLRFTGAPPNPEAELRVRIQGALEANNWTVKSVALDLPAAAAKLKCKGDPKGPECLAALGKWFNSNPKTVADYIVMGTYEVPGGGARITLFDVANNQTIREFDISLHEQDLVVPLVAPEAVVTSLNHHVAPPAPITADEQAQLLALDEPEKTPEELAAQQKAIDDAVAQAGADAAAGQTIDTADIPVDLKADFKDFCRTGPRTKRASREDPKDLRPKCQRGPFWGYWQPRAWVTLGLTGAALVGTLAAYSAALAARKPYKAAVKDVEDYVDAAGGDPRRDPRFARFGGQSYDALATEVSRTGSVVRQRAIVGDALLGTSVLLAGVLAIMIFQDRKDAKGFIRDEKGRKALLGHGFSVGPIVTDRTRGMALGFRF